MKIYRLFLFLVIFLFNIWCYNGYCFEKINNKTRVYDLDDKYIYGFMDSKLQIIEINDYKNMKLKSSVIEREIFDVNINIFKNKLFLSGIRKENGESFLDIFIYDVSNRKKPFKINEFSIESDYYLFNENNGIIHLLLRSNKGSSIVSIDLNNQKNNYSISELDCDNFKFMYVSQKNLYVICDKSTIDNKRNLIYKFNINNEKINYINKVEVDGDIISKNFVDEYMGNLRFVLFGNNQENGIYNLGKNLEVVNFIKDERLKNLNSIYFNKNICYVSSFLSEGYILSYDLSEDNFKEIGMMKLPSLKNLIYMVNDNKMIILGNESRGNTYKNFQSDKVYEIVKNVGISLMLVDVNYNKSMSIKDSYLIKGKQIYLPCFFDKSKFLYMDGKDILIFPIDISNYSGDLDMNGIMEVNNNFYKSSIFNYDTFFNGIYGFNIDKSINLRFIVDNYNEFKISKYLDIEFMDIFNENLFIFTKDCLKIFNLNGEVLGVFDFKNS